MRKIVIMPGGFHPFHAGHAALYKSAVEAFNDADVYVAATNDTKTRPFPFAIKEKLAKLAGVADKHFVQVKSPFQPREITDHYNPAEDVVIFVRSEKDRNESPKPGGTKKDGTPAYFQPWTGKDVQPFGKHAYIAYLPTVEFGPGITSATEIRNAWPTLNDKRKTAMVMSLYPVTQKNPKLAANVVKMLDMGMGNELTEGSLNEFVPPSSEGGGENERSRRIRKLLEIAIQVAKEKNVDELGMIHAMNMIAGDDYFNVAVEGILPDITDKEYMFVLQNAYKTVKQGVAEGVPQPGKSSGKPISWIDPTKVVTEYLTLDEIFKSVSGIPYYNNVVTDRDNKDFTWGVTKRVIQYAKELVIRPDAYKNWPPIIVLDGKLQDGAHRISTIYLMQQRVQPNNPIWKNAKLKVEFGTSDNVKQGLAEGEEIAEGPFVQRIVRPNKVNIYVRHDSKKPALLIATDIPYSIYDKFITKAMQKYPQFKKTDFSFKSSDKIKEETNLSKSADYLDEN
jgi:hypothetical protein